MSDTFCVLPWVNISTDPDGRIKPCCISKDFIGEYNLGHDKISDFYNSKEFVEIRTKMLNNEEVSGCEVCYNQEKNNNESHRLVYNKLFSKKQFDSPIADPTIYYFDLRFGNLCNLNCRTCMPKNSTQFSKEISFIKDTRILKYQTPVADINDWYQTEIFEKNLEEQFQNLRLLYLTGGEPTIVEYNYKFMEKLREMNLSKDIVLKLNTNMTNDKPKFFELIKSFKSVLFFASIDGYGDIQNYIRYPSNFNQIDKNLRRLLDKDFTNVQIKVTPVVQLLNLGYITELFDYFENFNRVANKTVIEIMPIVLQNPDYMSLENAPIDYKIKCWDKFSESIENYKFQGKTFSDKLDDIKTKCFSNVDYQDKLVQFFEYNDILDNHRGTFLCDVNPELDRLRPT